MVVASGVELHVSPEGIGVDGEAVGDDLASRGHRETRVGLMIFPKEGERNPWRRRGCQRREDSDGFETWQEKGFALTRRAASSRVTDARVLVVSEVEKSVAVVSFQKNALVDHSLNNVCKPKAPTRNS